jgi:ribonuclease HI
VAEYQGVLVGLRVLYRAGWRGQVTICSDSQLVVRQFAGEWGCYEPALLEFLEKLRHAATFFDGLALEWVRRERNNAADALARRGLELARLRGRCAS